MRNPLLFLTPRLVGDRFEGHAIPLEMLKDLAALEALIKATAIWCYKEATHRKRQPRGFSDQICLKITEIKDGSAEAQIQLYNYTDQLIPESAQYCEKSRELIIGAINAATHDEDITSFLPPSLLIHFDRLGRNLQENEWIEFDPKNLTRKAILNQITRHKLLLASAQEEISEKLIQKGMIPAADQDNETFELQLSTGRKVKVFFSAQHRKTILDAFIEYDQGIRVSVEGIGRYDKKGNLRHIDSVEQLNILDPNDISTRLDEFRDLSNGWLGEGKGLAPNGAGLDWLDEGFQTLYPDDLPLPYLYPTAEGGIQAEWTVNEIETSLEINLENHRGVWHSLNMKTDIENSKKINLANNDGWQELVLSIKQIIGGGK